MIPQRASGILAHISSLPSPYGIGDLGWSCEYFLDFLQKAKQSCWQILPTVPTQGIYSHSPYMSISAFAGNPLLISPQLLVEDGFLHQDDITNHPQFSPYLTDYDAVSNWKNNLLKKAAHHFFSDSTLHKRFKNDYKEFKEQSPWLTDYALFMTLKKKFKGKAWNEWPRDFTQRNPEALIQFSKKYHTEIQQYHIEQFLFFRQWQEMRKNAQKKRVSLIGDLPIYVSFDSVDVWTNSEIFILDEKDFSPKYVAGVPPDYFSKTGQRWGNPLYDWHNTKSKTQDKLYLWWEKRLHHTFSMVDITRIDHFRGFDSYWAIPAKNETAEEGEWLTGPGIKFFNEMEKRLGSLPVIAEDLGIITESVRKLLKATGFANMKVLLFAFDGNPQNPFLPHNYENSNCIVYTGTHDNSTVVGWFFDERRSEEERFLVKSYSNSRGGDNHEIHKNMIFLAHSSTACLSIIALQDLLGFGNDCRMNIPGQAEGNWRWRCPAENLTDDKAAFLAKTTLLFNRWKTTSNK